TGFRGSCRCSSDFTPGCMDRRSWKTSPLEGRFSSRPEYATQLLADLYRKLSRIGRRFYQLAMEAPAYLQKIYKIVFRSGWNECSRRDHPGWRTHGRVDPVFPGSNRGGLAGAPFLPSLALFHGSGFSGEQGLSLVERYRCIPG